MHGCDVVPFEVCRSFALVLLNLEQECCDIIVTLGKDIRRGGTADI